MARLWKNGENGKPVQNCPICLLFPINFSISPIFPSPCGWAANSAAANAEACGDLRVPAMYVRMGQRWAAYQQKLNSEGKAAFDDDLEDEDLSTDMKREVRAQHRGDPGPDARFALHCRGGDQPIRLGIGGGGARGGGGGADGLFAQQEREPIRGRPTVRGKRTYSGRPGQRVEEKDTWASRTQKHSEAGYGRPVDRGAWTAKTVKRPRQQPAHPQYANCWAPLTRKRHTMSHSAQPQHTNHWAPRTRKRHQQEHRPQRPTERSDPTQHAKGRTGDRPGPRKGATTRRKCHTGGGG